MTINMLSDDSRVKRHVLATDSRMLSFDSMGGAKELNVSTIGDRVQFALDAEGRSQNSLEVTLKQKGMLGKSRGAMSSLISGRRGRHTMKVDILVAIAEALHVRLEWLATGAEPMRRDGRVEQTPFEIAMSWARAAGCREDAIQTAWDKFGTQDPALGVFEWSLAFDREARDLDLRKVPRPEVVIAAQEAIRRQKKKLERAQSDEPEAEPQTLPSRSRRVPGGI